MRGTGWLLVFACAGLLMARAQEAGESSSRRAVLALEQSWSDAEARGDIPSLDRIFDNALVYIENGRLMTRGEWLSRMRSAGAHARQIELGTTTVQIFGSTAIVVGSYGDRGAKDGKTLVRRWRFIDTWVNKQGTWVLVATGSAPLAK
jgi:hypothetical protein